MKLKLARKAINSVKPEFQITASWEEMMHSWKGYLILGLMVATIEIFVSYW
jgi:hypothetical protein